MPYVPYLSWEGPEPSNVAPSPPPPPPPPTELTTLLMTPFLIQGPRFNTPSTTQLDYYINCDAVEDGSGGQAFGSWFLQSYGSLTSNAGSVLADNTGLDNSTPSAAYIDIVRTRGSKLCASFGGYYADVLGLFGPSQIARPSGTTNPSVSDLISSWCAVAYQGSTTPNPLGFSRANFGSTYWDGFNLDFENIGFGGNPNVSNTYPPPQSPLPNFPADATNPTYAPYIQALADCARLHHQFAPTKILTQAPLSLSINEDGGNEPGGSGRTAGGNVATSTALCTWFAFPNSSTAPTSSSYNATASLALNHPEQLKYCDDIFVQFYNESADNYLGGVNFPTLLAQWGYVCLLAQGLGVKTPKVNIGLAKGDGSTPPLSLPYYYPTYQTVSPPNPDATNPVGNTYPNIGPAIDAGNLESALNQANALINSSGTFSGKVISDWCSGAGFWAGGPATLAAAAIYSPDGIVDVPSLPHQYTYCWSDAQYPAPDPLWKDYTPIHYVAPS